MIPGAVPSPVPTVKAEWTGSGRLTPQGTFLPMPRFSVDLAFSGGGEVSFQGHQDPLYLSSWIGLWLITAPVSDLYASPLREASSTSLDPGYRSWMSPDCCSSVG